MEALLEQRLNRGGGQVAASMPTSRISERSSGKMPTTSVRRPISLLKRSSGFVLGSLD
jgi:hypothetical protein